MRQVCTSFFRDAFRLVGCDWSCVSLVLFLVLLRLVSKSVNSKMFLSSTSCRISSTGGMYQYGLPGDHRHHRNLFWLYEKRVLQRYAIARQFELQHTRHAVSPAQYHIDLAGNMSATHSLKTNRMGYSTPYQDGIPLHAPGVCVAAGLTAIVVLHGPFSTVTQRGVY